MTSSSLSKTQRRRRRPTLTALISTLILTLITTIILLPHQTTATITLSTTGKQYHSRPASFGFNLEYGLQYVALLQVAEDDLHLCGGEEEFIDHHEESSLDFSMDGWGEEGEYEEGIEFFSVVQDKADEGGKKSVSQRRGLRASASSSFSLKTVGVLPKQQGGTATSVKNVLLQGLGEEMHRPVVGPGSIHHDPVNIGNLGEEDEDGEEGGSNNNNSGSKNETAKEIHVTPSHGVPVAILAKRGQCTYETKARIASQHTSPHGTVRFVIVYDNEERDGNHLITMMPKDDVDGSGEHRKGHELWKDVGLVFVSYESGVDLHEFINSQPHHVKDEGGPRILIDGSDHWVFPPMDESAAGLAFLLMLFGCVCSLSLFLNTTFYGTAGRSGESAGNDHHLFFLGPDGLISDGGRNGNANANGGSGRRGQRGNGLRLLTMEEVETLPTREYGDSSSPLSPDLELRDKSEMPYMQDEYDQNNHGENNNTLGAQESSLHDGTTMNTEEEEEVCQDLPRGGLCDALLPTKKEDPYFDHNSCSICLDEYELGEQIRVLPCQHTFHSNCIFPWLTERSPTCPLCKAMFEAVQYEEEDEEEEDGEGQDVTDGEAVGEGGRATSRRQRQQPPGDGEQAAGLPSTSQPSPPMEDEPPVHRRRQRGRRQRPGERNEDRPSSRRSRRRNDEESSSNANAATTESTTVTEDIEAPEAAAVSSGSEDEEPSAPVRRPQSSTSSSSGLRGRFWGLFGGAAATSGATSDASPSAANGASVNALEEPLLASDNEGANDNVV